jgi:alpha-L-fucosidase 2
MNFKSIKFISFFLILINIIVSGRAQTNQESLKIWFDKPAPDWNTALPVGNGSLGAMIFGHPEKERIQLNEESVWIGHEMPYHNPKAQEGLKEVRKLLFEGKYAEAEKIGQEKLMGNKSQYTTYQTLGDLSLVFPKLKEISGYRRDLDLETAVANVSYTGDGILYKREIFSSAPDQSLVIRLTADKVSSITFTAALSRPGNKAAVKSHPHGITMTEHINNGNGVLFYTKLKFVPDGGTMIYDTIAGTVTITNANSVTLCLTASTNYGDKNPETLSKENILKASAKTYEQLKDDHIKDYQYYFKRVDLSLGKTETSTASLPTDQRLSAFKAGITNDTELLKLYYQFGRYLLISSSRPNSLPANLQGIWADGLNPPWDCDYHININIQMNYWHSETTNLSELHMPFLKFINDLRPNARNTAKIMYGIDGTVAHFATDLWHYTEPWGKTDWAMWPMGMAWSCRHLWEHYQFTGDKEYLKTTAYPAMKEAAQFCNSWLVVNPKTKKLVSGPSISPENKFITKDGEVASLVMGPTMDHMIIRDLFNATIEASKVIGTDSAFRIQLQKSLANLSPTKIASDGRIMEWTEEFKEENPGHRHISHLYGLYPSNEISIKTPELLAAARKTIDYRLANGGGHTGWSRAWIINYFARMQDGKAAYGNLIALIQKSTLDNLFDNHPPFQIDGNFGATAGITEMLLQSHAGEIHLLPALPKEWHTGYIKGLVARGGFEINMKWENGILKSIEILSKLGNDCIVHYGDKVVSMKTEKGKTYTLNGELK